MNKRSLLPLFMLLAVAMPSEAQRITQTLNSNWEFHLGNESMQPADSNAAGWTWITVPHTWNTQDTEDDEPGYYRGTGWYKKKLYIPSGWKDKDIYLFFNGVAQQADVYINGKPAGSHKGGYTAFCIPASAYLSYKAGAANELLIKADNSENETIPPLSGDFTFFGGIYRDVQVIALNKVHFNMGDHGSGGVFITTPTVSAEQASVTIRGSFVNNSGQRKELTLTHRLTDAAGMTIAQDTIVYHVNPGEKTAFLRNMNVAHPRLWSPDAPYLYRISAQLTDRHTGKILDEVVNPLGFRWYRFDAAKGFFLNGKPLKLIGTSRHQDYAGMGNALSRAMHIHDVELLKQMGGNFLRIAHYPQDPAVIEACDRLGILASVETPVVNRISESEDFARNALNMHLEMIRQNFNHPSLIIWAYMNEVLLRPRYEKGSPEQEAYFKKITSLARKLELLTRKEDPYRYTLIPNHADFDLYNRLQLTKIPMLVGWNCYQGWYTGNFKDFERFVEWHHRELPQKPLLITEYGADADNRLHSSSPVRFDKTVEYATAYHRAYLETIRSKPFIAGAVIWNLADFSSETRAESTPHINSKGVLTMDRKVKDAYRFYQANLLKTPYLHIGSPEWDLRAGIARPGNKPVCTQPVQVFSNQEEIVLKLNGQTLGTAKPRSGIAVFQVPFINGPNLLQAASGDGKVTDQATIDFQIIPTRLNDKDLPFTSLNVNLGDQRYFYDPADHEIWLPEKEYAKGSWGYIGGHVFKKKDSRVAYGSDKNMLGTGLDPVYATQREGIKQFKMDVPDGVYTITLHFAELHSPRQHETLVYNLSGSEAAPDHFSVRTFNVDINGGPFLSPLSNQQYMVPERAVSFTTTVSAQQNKGITIVFTPIEGEPVLNGIQVRKIY
ncbi:beta-galactosidase [Niabella ginsenosidivorans]|uniref:Beta-galactosidase n=1 Tax=Niabella ginsenosidivorans TaxID=1176587 RepID=A0A1A9I1T3_9BACT|nr:glycoside hydrolase family 2 TIM barrel-domain containing protein [Niabella ginsenosidivorans]ANH81586.1 beta-galactosidase [Niabella ginsenosidivorans]